MSSYDYQDGQIRWETTVTQVGEDVFTTVFDSVGDAPARIGYITHKEFTYPEPEEGVDIEPIETEFEFIAVKEWFKEGLRHREDDPAVIAWDHEGNVLYEHHYLEGQWLDPYEDLGFKRKDSKPAKATRAFNIAGQEFSL